MAIQDIEIYIGLAIESNDSKNPSTVIEKAKWFNNNATVRQRKEILLPIVQSKDPIGYLHQKITDFLSKERMRKGVFQ